MALRVWLPLNGTLENKGISDPTIGLVGTPTVNNSGKIGKCYTFSGSNGVSIAQQILPSQTPAWSFACWFSLSNTTTTTAACLFSERTAANQNGYTVFIYPNNSIMLVDDGTRWTVTPMTFSAGTWYHLVVTRDSLEKKIYINGELKSSTTTIGNTTAVNINGCLVGLAQSSAALETGDQGFIGNLNDVRIYDHCLSPKEIKEISQGLVLHYKLDGLSQGNGNNLVTGLTKGGQTTVVGDTIVTSGQNSDTYFKIVLSSALELNKSYTMGIDAENLPDDGFFRFPIGAQNNSSAGYIDIYNGHNEAVFIANDVIVNCGTSLMMDDVNRTAWPNQCVFKNFYIYENTSITDSSGYGNNGTVTGTLSTESDSNRYEISTYYSGSSYTDTGSGTFNWFDFSQCTLSAWIKPTASVSDWSGSIGVQHNQNAGHKGFTITDYANNFRVVTVNGSYTTIDSGKPLTVGEWHHCAAVLNGINLKMYYDGAMVKESTVSWGSAAIATDMRFATGVDFPGGDEMFTGNYSDVRMYCTALSAEDILDLYHTSANVDNLQNIHAFELKDNEDTSQTLKNGIMATEEFHESNSELLNSFSSGGYAPAKDTVNSCVDMGTADFTNYADLNKDLSIHIECDIEWTAFTAGTGGTFNGIWWQGSNYKKETSAYAWEGTNYVCNILNSTKSLHNATTVSSPGKYHYDVTTTIPASWFNTYSKSHVGFRCDYSNGTGRIDVTNFKITPSQYYDAKIGKDFISANNFIEK